MLTNGQKKELNIAAQRQASDAATEQDIKNLNYAKTNFNFEPMTLDDFNPEPEIELPEDQTDDGLANDMIGGAGSYTKTLDDYIKSLTPPETETSRQVGTLADEMAELRKQFALKPEDQLRAEKEVGLPGLKKDLAEINTQINTRLAEYDLLSKRAEATPIEGGMRIVRRFQTALEREKAAEIGLLQAKALGMQGEVETAQNTANRAIDLKYSVLESNINLYEKQLEAIKEVLSKEEIIAFEAQKRMLDDEKQRVADEKEREKEEQKMILDGYRKIQSPYKLTGLTEEDIVRMPNGDIYEKPKGFGDGDGQIVTAGGRVQLINKNTGEVIKDLGYAYKGGSGKDGEDTAEDKEIKEFQKEAGSLIKELDQNKISWAAAFDILKGKFPKASNATINAQLGGGIPYNPRTGEFDTAGAFGRAKSK